MVQSENTPEESEDRREQIRSLQSELEEAHQQLIRSEKMASLGEMTAGIAHEIRNPLNLVNNFAALTEELMSELDQALASGEDPREIIDDLKRNASVIVHHGHRADEAVGALMQLAGIGTSRHESTDVNEFVDEFLRVAYQSRQSVLEDFHCDVERHYDERIGKMLLNRQEMGRVLLNVLSNAFEAMNELSHARGRDYEPRIAVSTRLDNQHVEIKISDNGPGIPVDLRKQVFQPFFTTKKAGAGTGLGLSVSHDIVTGGHHGSLTVESGRSDGATIVIRLPLRQNPD